MNDVPVLIGHDLKFDVMRIDDQLLDVDLAVSESFLRFRARSVKPGPRLGSLCAARIPRPPPPATALIITRITNLSSRP